jgi:hypothetical protein
LSDCLFAANQISKKLGFGFAGNPVIDEFSVETLTCFGMGMDELMLELGDLAVIRAEALAYID